MRIIFITILFLFIFPWNSHAHHQLGLPHYAYSENYPQIPTLVIDADSEGYIVTFSTYPGNPKPGDTVRIKIYIKNKKTGKAYQKPITMSISSVYFFIFENEMSKAVTLTSEYNEYKVSYNFENAEKYHINVTFEPRPGFLETIPFPIIIGQTNFSFIPIIAGIFFLVIFIFVGIKKKSKTS